MIKKKERGKKKNEDPYAPIHHYNRIFHISFSQKNNNSNYFPKKKISSHASEKDLIGGEYGWL